MVWTDQIWEEEILPQLTTYIANPCKSPLFDPKWEEHGFLNEAVAQAEAWCRSRQVDGVAIEVVRLPGRTPLLFMEVPGEPGDGVLLYGHLDKQPEMEGWREDLGPWKPVRKGDRLYGRGGADDGYAAFASLAAIEGLRLHGGRHRRCSILIECSEESGSPDLPHYVEHLADRIGQINLVICLDSGAGDYDRLWGTTSLRGMIGGNLVIDVLQEGVHSGDASGIVPSSFRVLRQLLDRLEDSNTGRVLVEGCHAEISEERKSQARESGEILGEAVWGRFPFAEGVQSMANDPAEAVLQRTWRPSLSVTGAGGLPDLGDAGNVLRPRTSVKLSLRLAPTADWKSANEELKLLLETDPPCGARVEFQAEKGANGWDAPPLAPWLQNAVAQASHQFFGEPPAWMGEGGTIPFMGMLGERFPEAQFLVTGVLGPEANAHGPNEFLHIPTGKRLTASVALILDAHVRT